MTASATGDTIGGFTEEQIEDVAKTVVKGLADGAGRAIKWDELTTSQRQGYADAARAAITGQRTTGFAAHLTEGFRAQDKRQPQEQAEFEAQTQAVAAIESEFWKHAQEEFNRRRG